MSPFLGMRAVATSGLVSGAEKVAQAPAKLTPAGRLRRITSAGVR
jgi:hypothetical protein